MEKGLIFDIRRYSVHDGPGIRTTVFFKGCPLNCLWCHNPESIFPEPQSLRRNRPMEGKSRQVEETVGKWMNSNEVMQEVLKDFLFFEESSGGVTFSGGEPLLQPTFLMELLAKSREKGLRTAIDTSGHAAREVFMEVATHTDILLFDLKHADSTIHEEHTGVGNELIIQNLLALPTDGPQVYIRIPVIPEVNSRIDQMIPIRDILKRVRTRIMRVDLLPYHRLGHQKYQALGMVSPPEYGPALSDEHMQSVMNIFSEAGFDVKKGG